MRSSRGRIVAVFVAAGALAAPGLLWTAAGARGPQWLWWTISSVVAGVTAVVGMAVLLGPVARRMAGETGPLTARERKRLSIKDRVDAVNNARGTVLQAATGLVVVAGLIFTGAGLVYTARTLDVSARTLDATREGQLTDRYTKAVEQLGSTKVDVRLGGVYALQRLALDSDRDKITIIEVLVAYVRLHAHPPTSELVKGQARVDVAAALSVIARLSPSEPEFAFDLSAIDLQGMKVFGSASSPSAPNRCELGQGQPGTSTTSIRDSVWRYPFFG